jgi:acyl carrier protein
MPTEPGAVIREFIARRYPQREVADDDDIFSLGFVNSLFAMELVVFLEKAFTVTIPNSELRIDNFRTVDTMAALVDQLGSAGSTPVPSAG